MKDLELVQYACYKYLIFLEILRYSQNDNRKRASLSFESGPEGSSQRVEDRIRMTKEKSNKKSPIHC